MKSFEQAIQGRAVFIMLELIENEETKDMIEKQLKAEKKTIQKIAKGMAPSQSKGLKVLLKKI